jgi:MFS family permease
MTFGLKLAPQHRVYAAFCLHAISMGSIFPRMADIKQQMGVGEQTLGLSLIGVPTGTLLALTFATPLIERIGFRRTLLAAIPLVAFIYALALHALNPAAFFITLVPVGFLLGCVEIVLNTEADRVEHMIKRRIMNRAHSFWSFGFFSAGLVGAGLAQLGLSPQLGLALIAPFIALGVALLLGKFEAAPSRVVESDKERPKFSLPSLAVLGLVSVTLSAMLMEGAGIDWSAIYMRNIYSSGPFMAGIAVAVVTLSQAIARFFADGYIEKHSPASVTRLLSGVLLAGTIIASLAISPLLSLLGFALIGIGCSVMFPLAISAAAQMTDRPSAINVASMVQTSFMIFLLGPPLLGTLGEHFGTQWIYGFGAPLAILSLFTAAALGEKKQRASASSLSG